MENATQEKKAEASSPALKNGDIKDAAMKEFQELGVKEEKEVCPTGGYKLNDPALLAKQRVYVLQRLSARVWLFVTLVVT